MDFSTPKSSAVLALRGPPNLGVFFVSTGCQNSVFHSYYNWEHFSFRGHMVEGHEIRVNRKHFKLVFLIEKKVVLLGEISYWESLISRVPKG